MTYTILGRCGRTGEIGIAIATYSLAVGSLCPAIAGGGGVVSSQAFVNPELRRLGLEYLRQGRSAAETLGALLAVDPHIEFRQLLVLDGEGRGAGHTGTRTRPWTGHRVGAGYVIAGNVLASEKVLDAMARSFEGAIAGDLDDRLLRALEAGRDAGGQAGSAGHLPERSAVLMVAGPAPDDLLDLRVDLHGDAVTQLRAVREEYAPYRAFHRLRHVDPANAPPQERFVTELAELRQRSS
ncbi:MAG: DUF1028 domain-containing protein [Alphaproteobacteria bacterium]|nr:DUF1028 domain-containing protein [Alphaproteobacteria bacterium]